MNFILPPEECSRFIQRHVPVFMATVLLCLCTCALLVALVLLTYLREMEVGVALKVSFSLGLVLVLAMSAGKILIVQGLPYGSAVLAACFAACLAMALPAVEFRAPRALYFLAIMLPLLGMLLLNSRRHREMRARLREVRILRREYFQQLGRQSNRAP